MMVMWIQKQIVVLAITKLVVVTGALKTGMLRKQKLYNERGGFYTQFRKNAKRK